MRKPSRHRTRSRGRRVLTAATQMVALFAYAQIVDNWREWSFRTVTRRRAERMVEDGKAQAITRMDGGFVRVVGYRETEPARIERRSPSTLTFGTMQAVAADALHLRLSQGQRNEVLKFRVWPLIGDTRAVAVRPRMTDAERRLAEKLLASGGRRVA